MIQRSRSASRQFQICGTKTSAKASNLDLPGPRPNFERCRPGEKTPRRAYPSYSTGDLAPVLVTSSLSARSGESSPARSRSVAAGFERTGRGRQSGHGGSYDPGSGGLAVPGSLGSQRNLNVGSLLKGTMRTGAVAGTGAATGDLPHRPLRDGEALLPPPGTHTFQVRRLLSE